MSLCAVLFISLSPSLFLSLSLSLPPSLPLSPSLLLCPLYSSLPVCYLLWLARAQTDEQPIYILWRLLGICESKGKERVMWNVNRKTLISFLTSDSKWWFCRFACLSVFLRTRQSISLSACWWLSTPHFHWLPECVSWLPLFTSCGALRCPGSHRWDLGALKMNVQELRSRIYFHWTSAAYLSMLSHTYFFFCYSIWALSQCLSVLLATRTT